MYEENSVTEDSIDEDSTKELDIDGESDMDEDNIEEDNIYEEADRRSNTETYVNDNVIIFKPGIFTTPYGGTLVIQIIKRLYISPSQVIHGFDIDSCCILVNSKHEIFCTERCYYAIANSCNTVNFDRLSPSYEHRLMKYYIRGFDIWIPHSKFFKDNFIFDVNATTQNKSMTIFVKFLLAKYRRKETMKSICDYNYILHTKPTKYNKEFINFKTLNPNEQISGTFHKIVIEDVRNWYPQLPVVSDKFSCMDFFDLEEYDSEKYAEIPIDMENKILFARNITRKNIVGKKYSVRSEIYKKFAYFLSSILPGSFIFGNFVAQIISNNLQSGTDAPIIIWNNAEIPNVKEFVKNLYEFLVSLYVIEAEKAFKTHCESFNFKYPKYDLNDYKLEIEFSENDGNKIFNVHLIGKFLNGSSRGCCMFKYTSNKRNDDYFLYRFTIPKIHILNHIYISNQIIEYMEMEDNEYCQLYYTQNKIFTTHYNYMKLSNSISDRTEILSYDYINKFMN